MKLNSLIPNLAVASVEQTIQFYRDNLGFEVVVTVPPVDEKVADYLFAIVKKDGVSVMLQRSDSFREDVPFATQVDIGASASLFIDGEGIEALHAKLKRNNLRITDTKVTSYGMKEFYLKDNNGYVLCFGEKVGQ